MGSISASARWLMPATAIHLAKSEPSLFHRERPRAAWELCFRFAEGRLPNGGAAAQQRLLPRLVRRLQTKRREPRSIAGGRWHGACSRDRGPREAEGRKHGEGCRVVDGRGGAGGGGMR